MAAKSLAAASHRINRDCRRRRQFPLAVPPPLEIWRTPECPVASASHGVGELVGFIRSANPFFNNGEIFRELYDLLDRWIARGWLQLRPSLAYPTDLKSIDELLPFLNRVGPDAMDIDSNAVLPEVDLTDQAFVDVEWLRGAV